MSALSHFLCRRDSVNIGLSGNFLETVGTHHQCQHGYWIWVLKFAFFLVGPKVVWPSNCLKIHPVAIFLLLTALASLHPLGFLKPSVSSHSSPRAQLQWMHFNKVTTKWHPELLATLLQPPSSWAVMVWLRNVFARLQTCRGTHCPDSRI